MKVPAEALTPYLHLVTDADSLEFLQWFDEPPGARVLEVGAHDEPLANILSAAGYSVTGVDLREYDPRQDREGKRNEPLPPCNYGYLRADFCDLPSWWLNQRFGTFDSAFSISAIEHFGLNTYGEGKAQPFYDVIAMRTVWQLLKENGTAYITVPFGAKYVENVPHWRIYSFLSAQARLVQDFQVEGCRCFVADTAEINGRVRQQGDEISWVDATGYDGIVPHVSVILKLRKVPINRLAPDGR